MPSSRLQLGPPALLRSRSCVGRTSLPRFKPLAVAGELEDATVMNEAVDDGSCSHRVREDVGSVRERKVRRYRDAASLISLRDNLEQQIRGLTFERDVAELVDQNDVVTIERA